jgi:hypothetical protein
VEIDDREQLRLGVVGLGYREPNLVRVLAESREIRASATLCGCPIRQSFHGFAVDRDYVGSWPLMTSTMVVA